MKYPKFSHKTPHLKGKQHILDPNLDLKQSIRHSTIQYVDWDVDGDVDEYDKKPKLVPDENPTANFAKDSKKLISKQRGEMKHTKVGIAYEEKEHDMDTEGEVRYCPLCDKRESRSECSYGEKAWDKVSVKDDEYSMARSELETISKAVSKIKSKVNRGEGDLEAWVQSKITKAADYIDTAADYISSGEMKESIGFEIGSGHKDAQKKQKLFKKGSKTDNPHEKTAFLSRTGPQLPKIDQKEEKLVDKIIKELQEEDPCWKGYTQVGMKKKNNKEVPNCVPSNGVPKAKGYKKEDVDLREEDPCWKGYKQVGMKKKKNKKVPNCVPANEQTEIQEATRLQAQSGNVVAVTLQWRGKYYALRMFFPQTKLPTRKDISTELQKIYPGCVIVYHSISQFDQGQPMIQVGPLGGSSAKPGPSKNYVKPMGEELELHEDWQKINRKDKTDGLSQKAVNAYRRENPGSKLQTAVTEKKPSGKRKKRRNSFCRRMKGMKSKLTSSKTARNPDSRINKALRRWNCN